MNSIAVFLLLLLGVSSYINYKLYDQHVHDVAVLEHNHDEIGKLERDLVIARNQSQTQFDQEKQLIQNIDDQIKQKNAEVARLEDQLKGFGSGDAAGNNPTTLEWDIRHQKEIVFDLEKQLGALKSQESEAGNISKLSQSQAKQQQVDAENNMQQQIETQTQTLHDLQSQLAQAKHDRLTKDAILNMQNQVNAQRNIVEGLKLQKQTLKAQWNQSINSTKGQSQAALAGIKQNEKEIQDKIQNEKNHLRDLEKNYDSTKHVVGQRLNQINQVQKQRDDAKAQIARLQSDREGHVRRLAALAPQ